VQASAVAAGDRRRQHRRQFESTIQEPPFSRQPVQLEQRHARRHMRQRLVGQWPGGLRPMPQHIDRIRLCVSTGREQPLYGDALAEAPDLEGIAHRGRAHPVNQGQ
jgi:hypothetical protein